MGRIPRIFFIVVLFLVLPAIIFAREIKPGVTIDKDNLNHYLPALMKLLDEGSQVFIVDAIRKGAITLPVVEPLDCPQPWPLDDFTQKYKGECKVGPNNELMGWKTGLPFPLPKSAAEVAWNIDRKMVVVDQGSQITKFPLYTQGKVERIYEWYWQSMRYNGRFFVPPLGEVEEGNPENIYIKELISIREPFDVKGFCMIRTRSEDVFKPDDVYSYIPAIRRMRRMTGADVTDPMLGTDIIYDDFEAWRQKITPQMTFGPLEIKKLLMPVASKERPVFDLPGHYLPPQAAWEIREFYRIETYSNDPNLSYGTRVAYAFKDRRVGGCSPGVLTYDRRGRLWRALLCYHAQVPPHYPGWPWYVNWFNARTMHSTVWWWVTRTNPNRDIRKKDFTFRYAISRSR